jgi:hypothetical protein
MTTGVPTWARCRHPMPTSAAWQVCKTRFDIFALYMEMRGDISSLYTEVQHQTVQCCALCFAGTNWT